MVERAALQACRHFKLERAARHVRGPIGDQRAARSGASLEFHGYRDYQPGDDPRRIAWSVFLRRRALTVRVDQAELQPRCDVLLDVSRSMGLLDARKPELPRELALFAWHSARLQGCRSRLHALGDTMRPWEASQPPASDAVSCTIFEQPRRCSEQLPAGGLRVLISDFMSERAPEHAIRALASGAARLSVVMTLGAWEANPALEPGVRLIDSERGGEQLAELSARALARYRARLSRLQETVHASCRAAAAAFGLVVCDASLLEVLRRDLLPAGLVSPA
jgi:uncharacterized protein (DUF58 family)